MTLLVAASMLVAFGCEERQAGQGVGATATQQTPKKKVDKKDEGTPGVTDKTIKIGSYGPLSGPAAAWGAVLHGMNAYFQYVNSKGGINGRKIEFIYRDDQYNPAKTPAVVRELVEKEKVFAIIGGIGTANGRAVAEYLQKKNVPLFTPASGDKYWTDQGGPKNLYTVYPKYVTEGEILGNYVGKELSAKKVAVLYQNDDFGKQGMEGLKKGLAKHEGAEVVAEVSCLPTDTDLSGQVSQIAEKEPDVLAVFAAPKQAVAAVKKLDEQKKKPQVVTSFVLSDPIMFKLGGESWEGTITSAVMKLATSDDESVKLYRETLEKFGGGKLPAGTFTEAGYMFAQPFVHAMDKAGKKLTRAALYKQLESMKGFQGGGPHWQGGGLGPAITFAKNKRQGANHIFLAKATGGKWEKLTEWMTVGEEETVKASAEEEDDKGESKTTDDKKGDAPDSKKDEAKPPAEPKKADAPPAK
jgi:ABC-type branched-subunit amino acid transport system substrate-binding protein